MTSLVVILPTLLTLTSRLGEVNHQLLLWINGLAGRSWLFDNVLAFFLDNDLAKAGVIGCCLLAAWYGGKTTNGTRDKRKILVTTLIAAVFVITTTKVLSHTTCRVQRFNHKRFIGLKAISLSK